MHTKNKYVLPHSRKEQVIAVSDPRVHFAHAQHAIDFVLPEGTEIVAAQSGIVLLLKVDSKEGGDDPKYNNDKYQNYLIIRHENGEYSYYGHLQYGGALVGVGDKVGKGQPIALSGNVGFTTAPHLHFCVFILTPHIGAGWKTLEIVFDEEIFVDRRMGEISESLERYLKRVKGGLAN